MFDEPPNRMDAGDWRTQLQTHARHLNINEIMRTLKWELPFPGQEELFELKQIAVRFEETIYSTATSLSDYIRKLLQSMSSKETRSQMLSPILSQSAQLQQQLTMNQQERASTVDSAAQTGDPNSVYWEEEVFRKITCMKEKYLPDIMKLYQKVSRALQEVQTNPALHPQHARLSEKLKVFNEMLERFIRFLEIRKSNLTSVHREKLASFEKQIINYLTVFRTFRSQ